jgi:hypothetical protein
MGKDLKYGTVTTQHKAIPDDEPVILLRGQDVFCAPTARAYLAILAENGMANTPLAVAMRRALVAVQVWQAEHPDRLKIPD